MSAASRLRADIQAFLCESAASYARTTFDWIAQLAFSGYLPRAKREGAFFADDLSRFPPEERASALEALLSHSVILDETGRGMILEIMHVQGRPAYFFLLPRKAEVER